MEKQMPFVYNNDKIKRSSIFVLGYIVCDEGELKVKHHKLYQAVYCGLCASARKNRAYALLPFYSYDFVFLALLRMLLLGETMEAEKDFCFLHPFRKGKKRIKNNKTFDYCVFASLVLTSGKIRDDLADGDASFKRKILGRCFLPILLSAQNRFIKADSSLSALATEVEKSLEKGRELEKSGADLDRMCSSFSETLSAIFSFGTEGVEKRILTGFGDKMGRFLYTLDALDDLEEDKKSGAFNPLLREGENLNLSRLDMVLSFYIDEMKKILDLTEGDPDLAALCDHIICRGLSKSVHRAIKPKME